MPIPKDREEAQRVAGLLAKHGGACATCGAALAMVGGSRRWVLFHGLPACLLDACIEPIRARVVAARKEQLAQKLPKEGKGV